MVHKHQLRVTPSPQPAGGASWMKDGASVPTTTPLFFHVSRVFVGRRLGEQRGERPRDLYLRQQAEPCGTCHQADGYTTLHAAGNASQEALWPSELRAVSYVRSGPAAELTSLAHQQSILAPEQIHQSSPSLVTKVRETKLATGH
eukprot:Skav225382  [mRNA]  locus=scaffold3431:102991:104688:+ [translate_table: standard]